MKKLIIISISLLMILMFSAFMPANELAAVPVNTQKANQTLKMLVSETVSLNLPRKKSYVSDLSKINFNEDFSNVKNVTWERKGDFDVATFTLKNEKVKAYFGMDSELVGTITNKTYNDLPAEGKKEINNQYPGYAIGQVLFFKSSPNDNYMVLFGNYIENADSYYVELIKGNKQIVVRVNPLGNVSYFSDLT